MPASPLLSRSSNKAAALIIVLAFVVLLTGLALTYFTRTTTDRQLAHSSYNDTSADLLARSALDIVVGDFKQEIANGSTATKVTGTLIYVPTSAANVVPVYSPTPAGGATPAILNLIRRSVRSDTIPSPAVGSRASAVNSTVDVSANGRSISLARWNRHYLVPKSNTTDTGTDPITAGFTAPNYWAPDWVIVTRAGPTPFGSWDARLADPSSTNTNYGVGRYAYAVYDEGGLLDLNVAGCPYPTPTPYPAFLMEVGRKGSLAMSDLRALVTATPTGTPFNNQIVGFRNYATTAQNTVSNWNFTTNNTTSIQDFLTYALGSPLSGGSFGARIGTSRDFGTVNPIYAPDGRTDQGFTTRAELINFFKSAFPSSLNTTTMVNMLQYLGSFSREQNKPSLPLTPTSVWPFTRVVLPQRFYLGNLNLVVYPSPTPTATVTSTPTPTVTPIPTATPTLPPTIQTALGLRFVSAATPTPTPPPPTPTATPTPSPCIGQVRWEYVGNQGAPNPTATPSPLSAIPAFPSDLTTLDFFQYINYALFGVTTADSTDMPYTLGIGAALIDLYDADALATGIYYGSSVATCDPGIGACLVYGAEQIGSTVWNPPPSCISPGPTPAQAFTNFVPPINLGFRNVGEFGWAYSILDAANNRNTNASPNFVIDFKDAYNSASNPDPALLDFFTYNSAPVRSGTVNLNTRQPLVLAAILEQAVFQGTSRPLTLPEAANAANSIVTSTTASPAMSRADIASLVAPLVRAGTKPFNASPNQDIQDVIARALSETTQTRTWGLLIDVVAQTGHYKPNATGLADFVVEGEKRYWLHIAIDRFDGSIVGQQLEEVTE